MLTIRFFRVGKKKQPSFKIVVTDSKRPPKAGRFVEEIGFYNPITKEKVLREDRAKHWLSKGAQPSDTVYNLLVSSKIVEGKKIAKHIYVKKETEVMAEAESVEPKSEAVASVEAAPVAPVQEQAEAQVAEPKEEEKKEE